MRRLALATLAVLAAAAPAQAADVRLRSVVVAPPGDGQLGSVAAAAVPGGAMVTWSGTVQPGPSERGAEVAGPVRTLEALAVDPLGVPRSSPFLLAEATDGPYAHGLLATATAPLAFWEHTRGTRASGMRLAPVLRGTEQEVEVEDLRAAPDGRAFAIARMSRSRLLVAWVFRPQATDDGRVLAQLVDRFGERRGPLQDLGELPGRDARGLAQRLALAADGRGGALLARFDGERLAVQALDARGRADELRGRVVEDAGRPGVLRVVHVRGRYLVVWSGGGLRAAAFDGFGTPLGPVRVLQRGRAVLGVPAAVPGRAAALVPYLGERGARVVAVGATGARLGEALRVRGAVQPPAVAPRPGGRAAVLAGRTRSRVLAGCVVLRGQRRAGEARCGRLPVG